MGPSEAMCGATPSKVCQRHTDFVGRRGQAIALLWPLFGSTPSFHLWLTGGCDAKQDLWRWPGTAGNQDQPGSPSQPASCPMSCLQERERERESPFPCICRCEAGARARAARTRLQRENQRGKLALQTSTQCACALFPRRREGEGPHRRLLRFHMLNHYWHRGPALQSLAQRAAIQTKIKGTTCLGVRRHLGTGCSGSGPWVGVSLQHSGCSLVPCGS